MEEVLVQFISAQRDFFPALLFLLRVREDTSVAIFNQGEHNPTTPTNNKRRVMVLVMNMVIAPFALNKDDTWMQVWWFQLAMNYYGAW